MQFEWDEDKNKTNINKHGISFQNAAKVFLDKNKIILFDSIHSTKAEQRYIVIGKVADILFVVYTERKENIRLISARLANAEEREIYNDNI